MGPLMIDRPIAVYLSISYLHFINGPIDPLMIGSNYQPDLYRHHATLKIPGIDNNVQLVVAVRTN